MSSRFSSNSEANASELLENLEGMFIRYVFGRFKSLITLRCVTRRKRLLLLLVLKQIPPNLKKILMHHIY